MDKLKLFLDKHLGQEITLSKTYHKYFMLHYDKKGVLLSYTERKDVIEKELRLCGYFCMITSEKMTAAQALIHYKGRDISEKIFSTDKSFIGSKSMRVHSIESLSAKIFIEFIALVIRNRIYNLLKETMLRMEAKANYLTVPAALRELEKIEMVRCGDRRYRLDHAVSRKQKTILSAFGLSEQDIQRLAGEVSEVLASNPSLQPDTVAENRESEEVWEYGEDEIDCFD